MPLTQQKCSCTEAEVSKVVAAEPEQEEEQQEQEQEREQEQEQEKLLARRKGCSKNININSNTDRSNGNFTQSGKDNGINTITVSRRAREHSQQWILLGSCSKGSPPSRRRCRCVCTWEMAV